MSEPVGPSLPQPPLGPVREIARTLAWAGHTYALGGSGLLAALGLTERVNDWDLQCDAEPQALRALFAARPHTFHGHGGCHADHKLTFTGEQTEIIVRFAFFAPEGVVRIATHVTQAWQGFPIASPEHWAMAYSLMGELEDDPRRRAKSDALFGWLAVHGGDAARVSELLREPIPPALAERLRALPLAR